MNKNYIIVIKNLSFLTLSRGVNVATKFFLAAYLIRVLGNVNYGILTWVDSLIQYFLIFINFGFNIYAAKYVVTYKSNPQKLNSIVSSIFTIKFLFLILSFLILYSLSYLDVFHLYNHFLFLMLLMGFGEVFFPIWYFQGIEKLQLATYIVVFSRIVLILGTLFFVVQEQDIINYIYVLVISNLLMGVVGYYILLKQYKFHFIKIKIKQINTILKEAYLFFLGLFLSLTFNLLTIFLIGLFYSMDYVSGFDIALKIVLVCIIPFDMLQQAIYPTIVRTKDKRMIKKSLFVSFLIGCFLSVMLFFFSEELLLLFGGKEMIFYKDVLKTLAIIPPMVAVTLILGTGTLVAFGFQKEFNLSLIIAALQFLFLVFILYIMNELTFWNLIYLRVFSDFVLMLIRVYYVTKRKILV